MRKIEIDYLRIFSMIAVIMIHVSSVYLDSSSYDSISAIDAAAYMNQMARFSVPLFIAISGLSLAINHKNYTYGQFIKHRFSKIAMPYLFWCAVYYVFSNRGALVLPPLEQVSYFLRGTLLGIMAPHLYFVIILIQFYFLYPWLKKWMDQAPHRTLIITGFITLIIQLVIYISCFQVFLVPEFLRPYLWFLFPTWIFYFYLGMYASRYFDQICKLAGDNFIFFLLGTGIYAYYFTIESFLTGSYELSIKPMILVYVPLAALTILGGSMYLKRLPILNRTVKFLSKHSMTIYFAHMLILYVLAKYEYFSQGAHPLAALLLCVLCISVLLAWVFDFIVAQIGNLLFRKNKTA